MIVPVYNESSTILSVIKNVRRSRVKPLQLIIVNDASTDGTNRLLKRHQSKIDVLINHRRNLGKGAALRSGIRAAIGQIVIFQDADLEYDPTDYPSLIGPIQQGQADVVYGSRFIGGKPHRVVYFWHYVGNVLLTLLTNLITNLNLSDMETGYKAFRRPIIQNLSLTENAFGIEPEITVKLAAKQARFYEVGIAYHGRTYEEGKKIGFRDFWIALKVILHYGLWA